LFFRLELAILIDFRAPGIVAVVVPTPFVTFAVIVIKKSTASQGAKTLCMSNMDVGCSQWGFLASTMILKHHTGSAIPP
jgi:hypothetical protein